MPEDIAWEALEWQSTERTSFVPADGGYVVNSQLKGVVDSVAFDLAYTLRVDAQWRVRAISISSQAASDTKLVDLLADGNGNWTDAAGQPLPQFRGCIDIDISLSPLTNTLPIRRLDFSGQPKQATTVVYISLPSGDLKPMHQWYTKHSDTVYTYEDENNYTNTIAVDQNGLVVDYPGLFKRVAS